MAAVNVIHEVPVDSSEVLLDNQFLVKDSGLMAVALFEDALTWHRLRNGRPTEVTCEAGMCIVPGKRSKTQSSTCPIREIYGVEVIEDPEPVRNRGLFQKPTMMYSFVVHTFLKEPLRRVPCEVRLYHQHVEICRMWAQQIKTLLRKDPERPQRLLVFVNPIGGHKQGLSRWEASKRVLDRAGIDLDVVVTTHRNHAFEAVTNCSEDDLSALDGIIVVGGDGFFNEVLNGLAKKWHPAPPCGRPQPLAPPLTTPLSLTATVNQAHSEPFPGETSIPKPRVTTLRSTSSVPGLEMPSSVRESAGYVGGDSANGSVTRGTHNAGAQWERVLLEGSGKGQREERGRGGGLCPPPAPSRQGEEGVGQQRGQSTGVFTREGLDLFNEGLKLKKKIRIGIIPAGSTDCIQMSATGSRDPETAAIHIALGDRMPLDVVRITSWCHGPNSAHLPDTPNISSTPKHAAQANEHSPMNGGEGREGEAEGLGNFIAANGGASSGGRAVEQSMAQDQARDRGHGGELCEVEDDRQVRYAASFVAYGFYGDVANHSEQLRWMGPARYDYAGFMTYMRHRSYDAEVTYLHMPSEDGAADLPAEQWSAGSKRPDTQSRKKAENKHKHFPDDHHHRGSDGSKDSCTTGCAVCANGKDFSRLARSSRDYDDSVHTTPGQSTLTTPRYSTAPGTPVQRNGGAVQEAGDWERAPFEGPYWSTLLGSFHSVGAAVVSCRNEKAPDGVAAHAHLADGMMHLILIRKCSRPEYLQQLVALTLKGADPLNFKFVENFKTPAFTFIAHGDRSMWNIDGELLDAKEVSGQVFRGLVDLFAAGPET